MRENLSEESICVIKFKVDAVFKTPPSVAFNVVPTAVENLAR